jgi:hypothetical protein
MRWFAVQRAHGATEIHYFPRAHQDIQNAQTRHCAAHPTRRDKSLQSVPGFVRREQQKVVVAPVAQTEPSMGYPRQYGKHDAYFETENYVEDYRES